MRTNRIRWLVHTVLVGLIPILSRCFAWLVTQPGTVELVAATDFVAFGLVLHVSTINELEHSTTDSATWKSAQTSAAVLFVTVYSVLYSIGLVSANVLDKDAMTRCAMGLALLSFLLNFSIYRHLDLALDRGS